MSNTEVSYKTKNKGSSLAEGFLYWHVRTPHAIAINTNEISYTYNELYKISSTIYSKIKYREDEIIAIQCVNDVRSYAALLAVSYIGAAYLPLNIKFPLEKLKNTITDAGVKTVLCFNDDLQSIIDASKQQLIKVEDKTSELIEQEVNLKNNSSLAYILYTSGSTGKPKGVPVSKENVNAFFNYFLSEYDFNKEDKFLQAYELSFDVSVFSVFCAWNVGASVYVVPESKAKHFEIINTIKKHQLTVTSMVPSVLNLLEKYFSEFNFPFVRYSFFSGDSLLHSLATKWKKCLPKGVIHNFYGPTETTIVCTRYVWDENTSAKESKNDIVPLGVPFPNMKFVLLNENHKTIENTNEAGELCFEGIQVIKNYLNTTSEENFILINNKRYYKTGDIASLNKNKNLIFHGRKDAQVKINGYRVELAEIENAINNHFNLNAKAIVIAKNGLNQICTFVESVDSRAGIELKEKLVKLIPYYMIPSFIVVIDKIPLSINGKVDVEKLKTMVTNS